MRSIVVVAIVIVVGCWTYEAPKYDDILFTCDATHACPSPQQCIGGTGDSVGVCQYVGSNRDGVMCGSATCVDTQCCYNGAIPFCLDPTMSCTGSAGGQTEAALCDGVEDCPTGMQCCENTQFSGASCSPTGCNEPFCVDGSDCTGTNRYCCPPDDVFEVYFWRCSQTMTSSLCKMNMMSR